jgi:hypothetical protein
MVYFTRGVNDGALTKVYYFSANLPDTYVLYKYRNSGPLFSSLSFFLFFSLCLSLFFFFFFFFLYRKSYKNILLISDGLVSFYLGEGKADGYKRKYLLPLAKLFFTLVYSTGPSPAVSDVQ